MTRPLSRRTFLAGGAAFGAAALAGCTNNSSTTSFDLGSASELRILNWPDYVDIDEDGGFGTVTRFGSEQTVRMQYDPAWEDNVSGFEIIEPALSSGSQLPYDIVVPTYWLAGRLIERGWVEPIPLEIVPNHVNIDPAYLTIDFDRGARFQMPWQAGITGVAYNTNQIEPGQIESVADFFALDGQIALIAEMREAIPFGMILNGDDPSRPTFETAEAGLLRISEAKDAGKIAAFTFNEFADLLTAGTVAAAMAWSGDTVQLQAAAPNIEFVVPADGAVRWFDTMIIAAGSPNVAAAGAWMNYVYDPTNAALITNWVQYISPVVGVQDALDDLGGDAAQLASNPILFPDDATKRRLFTWGGLPEAEEDEIEARFLEIAGIE